MQWLDDVDDLVLAMVHVTERLHWPCLEVAFAAACALLVVSSADIIGVWVPALTGIALAGVVLWAAGIGVRELQRLPAPIPDPSISRNA